MSSPMIQSNPIAAQGTMSTQCYAKPTLSLERKVISELHSLLHAASCQKRSDCVSDTL